MVDLPAPRPLQGVGALQQSLPRPSGPLPERVSQAVASKTGAQLVSVAKQLASKPAPIDHARVAEIKTSITSGTYRANPEDIARALLGNG